MRKFIFATLFLFLAMPAWAAFPAGWERSCKLTVDHHWVSGDVINFPVLVGYYAGANNDTNLPDEMMLAAGANAAQSNGGDIRFTLDAAGTIPLSYEIVTFTQADPVTDARAEIWVKLPSLSSTVDADFYVWYHATEAQTAPVAGDPVWGSQGVWSNGYSGIWHLPNGSSLTANDSTRNGNNGGLSGAPSAGTAVINGGATFNASNFIDMGSGASLKPSGPVTISTWVKPSAACLAANQGGTGCGFLGNSNWAEFTTGHGYSMVWHNNLNMYLFVEEWPSEKSVAVAASYFSADTWVAIAGVYDGANAYVYINGVVRGGPTAITNGPTTSTYNFFIGKSPQGGLSSPQFSGSMDEVRFSSTARSAQWIATEYNNQSAPETFILDGTPSAPASPSTVSSIGSVTGVSSITY